MRGNSCLEKQPRAVVREKRTVVQTYSEKFALNKTDKSLLIRSLIAVPTTALLGPAAGFLVAVSGVCPKVVDFVKESRVKNAKRKSAEKLSEEDKKQQEQVIDELSQLSRDLDTEKKSLQEYIETTIKPNQLGPKKPQMQDVSSSLQARIKRLSPDLADAIYSSSSENRKKELNTARGVLLSLCKSMEEGFDPAKPEEAVEKSLPLIWQDRKPEDAPLYEELTPDYQNKLRMQAAKGLQILQPQLFVNR